MTRLVRSVAGLSALISIAPLQAQRGDVRYGPWVTLGSGPGIANLSCRTCFAGSALGLAGFLEIGGTPSERVTAGINGTGWAEVGADTSRSFISLSALLYLFPSVEQQSLFLKLGGGVIRYTEKSDVQRFTANGFALHLGGGYEIPGPGHWHFAPHLGFIFSPSGRAQRNLIGLDDRLRLWMLSLALAVSWRR